MTWTWKEMCKRKSFVLYTDYAEHTKLLSTEEKGILFDAILSYASDEELPEMPPVVQMAFSFIRLQMDKDTEKYKQRAERSRANGRAGGRPKEDAEEPDGFYGLDEKPKKPTGFSGLLEKPRKPDNDNVNVNDNVKDKHIVQSAIEPPVNPTKDKQEADDIFNRLWALYPQKRGKGAVSDTQKRKLASIGYDEMKRAIERYKADVASADFDLQYKNGSTFFNTGYVDYLDANYTPRARGRGRGKVPNNRDFAGHVAEDYDALEE